MVISRNPQHSPDNSESFRRAHRLDPVALDRLRGQLNISTSTPDRVIELMSRCTSAAVELVSGVDHAGVTATLDNTPFTVAPTDPLVDAFDRAQYEFGDGPCLKASRSGDSVRMSLSDVERRWPTLADSARAAQLADFVAVPLFAEKSPVGSLNLYSRRSIDSSIRGQDLVAVLADYLGSALDVAVDHDKRSQAANALRVSIGARVDIERAVGVLMNQNDCDALDAFRELETRSSVNSDNILVVARQILASIDDESA